MKRKLNIEGMSCNHCVNHVKNALMEIEGINDVNVSLEEKFAIVEGKNLDDSKMKTEVEDWGYKVISIEEV
ncbi:heavy-metal-associated domain-containing protein [Clostridium botulinum]|uniref:Heavy metal transport/detoxification protein n=1 Tax=Clostridium botulinum C/D str. DC5 TaxID=1443128 RepID=A0A0A0IJB1_CLOBO|nr:heavy-metal-associated domain-containing protein [Clostridium botulinum]KEI01590.1 heavy metal transport/detoxification protein [Clostridium botulinum C/D str. BKT75002]KEI07924.1 heavy metal transport/detoxification protein [Clostridium botulinum C/D str. BKT2873]KGM96280.1 heavy metal transport/detoxification protein [Clostridium botulinum D str. CCUG 7971]KGN00342.1 heavy metal transport/detoxification protein [Clostridium botulinum C/D str. DC5]KOC46176.1 heavy metal transport/detoxific